ncbi:MULTISPECIES: hypothetical protein [unclassified Micromonospora]|uniref:hypothetical protein n=1 Tax=unclassified Micromonospora TaxID=2617518 RepID=UPI0022C8A7FD|nr:hypothetical protein [Micromonospora sp. AKA38]GHJ16453.1 hypothetical protein TPA0908_44480 [Micromonospora sp. AKA38]
MRSRTLIAVLAPFALAPFVLAAGLWWAHRPGETPWHDSAVADATETVDRLESRFDVDHLYQADEFVHAAGQEEAVEVLQVRGETHWQTGVTLVLRVTGHGVGVNDWGERVEGTEPVCFRLNLGPERDDRDDDIDCPTGDPLPVPRDPSLTGVDARLRAALTRSGPDEAAVRAAVAGLELDPAVRQEIAVRGGTVGVALRASQYDCLLARVGPTGAAETWRPSHVQLAPGELSCSAGLALSSQFGHSVR